jgi:hypothetical protein
MFSLWLKLTPCLIRLLAFPVFLVVIGLWLIYTLVLGVLGGEWVEIFWANTHDIRVRFD